VGTNGYFSSVRHNQENVKHFKRNITVGTNGYFSSVRHNQENVKHFKRNITVGKGVHRYKIALQEKHNGGKRCTQI
jgi:signal transduction histidine kinase